MNEPEVIEETKPVEETKPSMGKRIKSFFMTTTNGMAIGLFGTLIIGTIINLLGQIPNMSAVGELAKIIQGLMGAGIGLGVALSLKKSGVAVVAVMAAGFVGNYAFHWIGSAQWTLSSISDPLSCYLASLACLGALELLKGRKTPVDLILIPLLGIGTAIIYSIFLADWVHYITLGIGFVIESAFSVVPLLMCIIISVLVGMALTAPISSVAICVAIQIGNVPLAAASALIGCCVQMVGIAVETARDNKWGSVLAVGLGTSMLQFKNIIRKPVIWLPTIIVSAALAPFAMLFPLDKINQMLIDATSAGATEGQIAAWASVRTSLSVAGGMGTSGLVGPLNFLGSIGYDNWLLWVLLLGVCVVGAGVLVFLVDLLFRKIGWIKKGDFSLQNDL